MSVTLEDVKNVLDLGKKDGKHDKAVYGEVKAINADNTYQVSLNGSDTTVKCARLSGAKVGDTVLVEVLSNGYAVVTGTVGGDTDASDAQVSAAAAQSAAGQAQTAASAAQTAASAAETAAGQAVTKADQASAAAATADSKATAAGTAAAAAQTSADQAASAASTADSKATAASQAAARAEGKADTASAAASRAEASATNASEYAARALGNLSTVESVTETLNWITAHGTMTLTADTDLDPTHVYFVQDNNGDYTVGGTKYAIVTEPDVADISTYYELSINQSLNNYVGTHLAVTSEGLWLIPEEGATPTTSSKKILIAVGGTGHTYEGAGTYIIEKVNNVDTIIAKFTEDGAQIGRLTAAHSIIDENGQRFYGANGTVQLANIGYGEGQAESGTATAPYYTFGIRLAGSQKGNYSVAEGINVRASNYASHAEGALSKSDGLASHAEGDSTQALGSESHAEGNSTEAFGQFSHTQNLGTRALQDAQTAIGKYNVVDTEATASKQKALIIGNGTSDTARSNAFTVDWDGNTEAAGDITDGSGNVLSDKANTTSLADYLPLTGGTLTGALTGTDITAAGLLQGEDCRLALDTTATSGTDYELYSAISALGWTSDVIE